MRLLIEARGPDLSPAGLVESYTQAVVVPRYNGIGSWSVTVPAARLNPAVLAAWEARGGVRITDADQPDADPILSGPVTTDAESWGAGDRYGGTLTIAGSSDEEIVFGDRIAYPDPTSVWEDQGAESHHVVGPAPAETVIRTYVAANAGPGALLERRVPGLVLEPDSLRGAAVRGNARFTGLLELCQGLAVTGGIGFRVDQSAAGELVLRFYEPTLRQDVLLSTDAGTLRSGKSSVQAPALTHALVAGQGEQELRMLVERSDPAAATEWGRRIERLVDARQNGTAELLVQSGDEALAEGAARGAFSVEVQDTAQVQYGRDYRLGDVVPYVRRGVVLEDVVREVKITAEAGRTIVQPTLGPPDASSTPATYRRLQQLERAVKALRND